MVKLICFVKRNPALSVDEFHRHWREDHAGLILGTPVAREKVLRYEQNHRTARDYERADCPFDGVAVQWFASARDFWAMVADPGYQARVGTDERELLDLDGVIWMLTDEEEVVIPGPARREPPLTKLICAVKRRPGMSVDEFHRHWREVHGPLNRDAPGVARHFVRYEQNHRAAKDYERTGCDFDGATVEWFPSAREFFAMTTEPEYHDKVEPDEQAFLDRDALVWVLTDLEETVIGG